MSVLVLPHRSLSRAGLVGFLLAQGVAIAVFAGLAAVAGNVFAPGFAILAMWFVAFCFLRIWRKSGAGQIVTITPSHAGSRRRRRVHKRVLSSVLDESAPGAGPASRLAGAVADRFARYAKSRSARF